MINYEKKIAEMTVEQMALCKIQFDDYDGCFHTTDNKKFEYFDDALEHEIEWLNKEVTE